MVHGVGSSPESIVCLKSFVRTGASSVAISFRSLHGTSSGPDAFLGSMVNSNLRTPSFPITKSSIGGYAGPCSFVSFNGSSSSLVKADLNWFATQSYAVHFHCMA